MKNVVLVHGFWADSSSYSKIISHLQKNGVNVIAPQIALRSLEDDIATINLAIDDQEGDVLLVGHSYGGIVISGSGHHPKVKGLLFISAFAPDEGETMMDLLSKTEPTIAGGFFDIKGEYVWNKREGIQTAFAQDLPTEESDVLFAVQKAPKAAILGTKSGAPAWKEKENWFVITTNDQTVHPELQKLEATRMNAKITEVNGSHAAILSNPKEISNIILSVLKTN